MTSPSSGDPGDDPTLRDPWWRPGPSALAFVAALALLGAFTRIGLFEPPDLGDEARLELHALVPLLLAGVAVVHAAVAALAARLRHAATAVATLLLSTAALPLLAEPLRPTLHASLARVAPAYCEYTPHSCPPGAWPWWVGVVVGALLSPLVVAAVRLRGQRALDTTARMLFVTGLWTGVVAAALRVARLTGDEPLAFASTVAAACAGLGLADTALRWLRLSTLLRANRLSAGPAREGDPEGLCPYASLAGGAAAEAVLRLDEVSEGAPYREVRRGRALGRSPRDVSVLVSALAARGRRQLAGLVAVLAALAVAAVSGGGPAVDDSPTIRIVTSP